MQHVPFGCRFLVVFAVIAGVSVGVSMPTEAKKGAGAKRAPADNRDCKTDKDCVAVADDCCPCSQGGKARAIPKKQMDDYEKDRKKRCADTACTEMMSTDPTCAQEPVLRRGHLRAGRSAERGAEVRRGVEDGRQVEGGRQAEVRRQAQGRRKGQGERQAQGGRQGQGEREGQARRQAVERHRVLSRRRQGVGGVTQRSPLSITTQEAVPGAGQEIAGQMTLSAHAVCNHSLRIMSSSVLFLT